MVEYLQVRRPKTGIHKKDKGTVPQQAEARVRLGDGYHTMKYFNSHNEKIKEYLASNKSLKFDNFGKEQPLHK